MANDTDEQIFNTPTGTVTFLFTDIEGSTAMWEKDPSKMEAALRRHDQLLRSAVEAQEGYVFKTVGDAFCATFATAREALEATLSAQRALAAEPWDANATIRVRTALHTGVAEERDGDYFGPPVNRVARLLSAGHGGQVLLSAVTCGLVRDALSHTMPEADLLDLGEHRLKDLRHAECIYQLVVPDLPKDFPALKTLDTRSDERYSLSKLIGSGGMAEVYLAHDGELNRDVAFKVLRSQYTGDERFVERFKREAQNAASLSHPNIAAVYDRGQTEDGSYYLVMECVPGGTLEDRIRTESPLPPDEAVGLALQIARALEAAHERGVIHHDIKPQNVLLTESGDAKVADLGTARAASSNTTTQTGFILGTVYYLSPEQALGQSATPASDLYSLGVILYEMLTGKLPHDAETPVGVISKHVSGYLRPPREINPGVPEGLNDVVVRLLAKNPEERYGSAAGLAQDLEKVQRGASPAAAAVAPPAGAGSPEKFPVPKVRNARPDERYALKQLLGSGGMAEVYLAHDEELDRDVAFKVLRSQYTSDERFIERFRREARNAASLSHPNIISTYDRGETVNGSYYIVMEYAPGGTLAERIKKEGALPPNEAIELALQVARALGAAHETGMVHRDVKPQNVLLTRSGEAKVADFGIARAASSSTMTNTGAVMGTAHYLSPEQALGQSATARSDLYSLGAVLYEMLTGEVPHDAETPIGVAMKHVSGELRPPREANPNVPQALNDIVVRLMAKDPEERYGNAAELVEDLERVRHGEIPTAARRKASVPAPGRGPAGPRRRPRPSPSRSKRLLLKAAVAGLLLVALTGSAALALTGLDPTSLLGRSEPQPTKEPVAAAEAVTAEETTSAPEEKTDAASEVEETPSSAVSGGPVVEQSPAPQPDPTPQPAPEDLIDDVWTGSEGGSSGGGGSGNDGSETKPVPAVVGLPYGSAAKTLTDQGFKIEPRQVESDQPAGTVTETSPVAGTPIDPDATTVVLFTANGDYKGKPLEPPKTQPDPPKEEPEIKPLDPETQPDSPKEELESQQPAP